MSGSISRADIDRAAATAKLLGYQVKWTEAWQSIIDDWTVTVVCPKSLRVFFMYSYDADKPKPSINSLLGHFLTRLHMEKHYGIKTPHYWEVSK